MYTETLPGESLALMITSLSVEMEGRYYCTASYASTELLETSVMIKTYGKLNIHLHCEIKKYVEIKYLNKTKDMVDIC